MTTTRMCKRCKEDYPDDDNRTYEFRITPLSEMEYAAYHKGPCYGWMPTFNECFLCFLYALFGGLLEPQGPRWNPYPIDPYGPPCPPQNELRFPEEDEISF